ncbi:MAG TPA: helix-turn-helix domain-containing protein [Streptomyces sp.]|uniref:helix-turn-helix domain-containing protein n=1 Tax=Streptomyces sp. TaxID=1931 RepID=UPI002C1E8AD8|nr:helix-turn-helix domain-containing protein [Streptomyces sp.]HWU11438.1 helix-turn-helix domain-containing protein [Streptomyces sp.]
MTARPAQADEDTVRDVIHRFDGIDLDCPDPRRAGGRPRLLSPDDEDFVVAAAATRPARRIHTVTAPAVGSSSARRPTAARADERVLRPRARPA